MQRIGLLTIGQSPRPDLVQNLTWPVGVAQLQAGALDGLEAADIPPATGSFPLVTRLTSGQQVMVDEAFLEARLQAAVERLEAAGVAAILLLCAGTFARVRSRVPLFKPFDLVTATLHDWGIHRVVVVCPMAAQEPPMQARWSAAGFDAAVVTAPVHAGEEIAKAATSTRAQCVVLDYVGHAPAAVAALQATLPAPVIDVGALAASLLAATLAPPVPRPAA